MTVTPINLLSDCFPQLKGTYLVIYGKWPTFVFTVATILVGVVSSYSLGLNWLLWPLELFMITVSKPTSIVSMLPPFF